MTKEFDERNAAKSRRVCEDMEAAHVTKWLKLTERERQILDMWPRFEDGEPVWLGDEVGDFGGEIVDIYFNDKGAAIWNNACDHLHLAIGERAKRPAPKDSWERLEEDASKDTCVYFGGTGHFDCSECSSGGINCFRRMKLDLIRRAKALAGVEVAE